MTNLLLLLTIAYGLLYILYHSRKDITSVIFCLQPLPFDNILQLFSYREAYMHI